MRHRAFTVGRARSNIVTHHKNRRTRFVADPSQMVVGPDCADPDVRWLDWTLQRLPRRAFDYVWLIDPPYSTPSCLLEMTPIGAMCQMYCCIDRSFF